MPLALLIGFSAWVAVTVVVLTLCRAAAHGDRAMPVAADACDRYHVARLSPRGATSAQTSRVASRARAAGHRSARGRVGAH